MKQISTLLITILLVTTLSACDSGKYKNKYSDKEIRMVKTLLHEFETFKQMYEREETRNNKKIMRIQLEYIEQASDTLRLNTDDEELKVLAESVLGGAGMMYKGYLEKDKAQIEEGEKILKDIEKILK